MKTLRIGDSGDEVRQWQYFLTGQELYAGVVDGLFGEGTKAASMAFQKRHGLQPDGIVGNKTIGIAMSLGMEVVPDEHVGKESPSWPPRPAFPPLMSNGHRESLFGRFNYRHRPLPANRENIEVLDGWANANIIKVPIPQLNRVKGSPTVYFHRLAANQLARLWDDWERAGLMHHVLTWEGAYMPRFVRGNNKTLSNHAFGSAFDINYAWNTLGTMPALVGQKGSVRELVAIANENGFYWGGHFNRSDGMHFEVALLK
ncbi:M15 family metallopeptidase [Adhaeribacter soli]|uniref:Peptidoglycan-binding protein n=1 Tax=Adhaeribacter soli TaxID=2607655 RepID=A0A5N1J0U7_9BACT|nr:M15 family metallopeptidase [Adhaeribacter soli]KAA9340325.1 peptidoglycan-binding protein [Adhaeribacter soli]